MSIDAPFSPSPAFDAMVRHQNYFKCGRALSYDSAKQEYRREALWQTALRIASWFTLVAPLAMAIALHTAKGRAGAAIQERHDYWSGDSSATDSVLLRVSPYRHLQYQGTGDTGFHYVELKDKLVTALQHSDVPKTHFNRIFLAPVSHGQSFITFSSMDGRFPEDEHAEELEERQLAPDDTLVIFFDFGGNDTTDFKDRAFIKITDAATHHGYTTYGMSWEEVRKLGCDGVVPDDLKQLLAGGGW